MDKDRRAAAATAYSLFPSASPTNSPSPSSPKSSPPPQTLPSTITPTSHNNDSIAPAASVPASPGSRSRRSTDRRRRSISLDPLPPIEEPPEAPPASEPLHLRPSSQHSDSPVLKPIHSLYNPRPSSRSRRNNQIPDQQLGQQTQQRPSSRHRDQTPPRSSETHRIPSSSHRSSLQYQPPSVPPLPHISSEQQQQLQQGQTPPPSYSSQPDVQAHPQPTSSEMLAPSPSTESSNSIQKPPLLSPTSTLVVRPLAPAQKKVAYFHGGIGGRGNYRKVVRESNRAPLAHARNVSPPNGRSSRFLSSLFGSNKRRRGTSPNNGESNGDLAEGRKSEEESGGSDKEEVSLGAAEVMRRKLLKQAGLMPKNNRADSYERD